jgi:hypothetical protein
MSSFNGIVGAAQLAILTKVLTDYCTEHGIPDGVDRENVASTIMTLFVSGTASEEELRAALKASERRQDYRLG